LDYLCTKFCPMKKVYKVAGHRFSIEMPDSNPAWEMMHGNYDPFLVDDDGEVLFAVRYVDIMPDTTTKRLVTKDCPGEGFSEIGLYELEGRWLIEMTVPYSTEPTLFLLCEKDFSEALFHYTDDAHFSVETVLMVVYAFATACHDTLQMHASVTMHQGKGYVFLGKSGTGKSTHSRLWINNIEGCELLNDDNPVIRVHADGSVHVYGSPWSGKTPCYRNIDVPIGAIVDLHQAKTNVIRRLSLPEAYAVIYVSFSGFRFIKEMADGLHATNAKIVSRVPVFSLDCLPDADAAFVCHKAVTQQ